MAGEGLWWIRVEKRDTLVRRRRERDNKWRPVAVDEETREMRMRMRDW